MKNSFWSHPNSNETIATIFCTWHDRQLSWHVEEFVAIWWPGVMQLQQNAISMGSEMWIKMVSAIWTPGSCLQVGYRDFLQDGHSSDHQIFIVFKSLSSSWEFSYRYHRNSCIDTTPPERTGFRIEELIEMMTFNEKLPIFFTCKLSFLGLIVIRYLGCWFRFWQM